MVKFRCLQRGYCCRRYWIPVTHLDILRLVLYGGYNPLDIVEPLEASIYPPTTDIPAIRLSDGDYYIALKIERDGSCIFLNRDGKCKVHEFKPLVCRFYPFIYVVRNGDIVIEVNTTALGECPGLVLDDKPIPQHIVEALQKLAKVRIEELRLWRELINEWNNSVAGSRNFKEFVRFAIKRAWADHTYLKRRGLLVK